MAAWLRAGGVRRVMVGHRPSGDSPAVLSAQYTGVEVVSADISYSDTRAADMRGATRARAPHRAPLCPSLALPLPPPHARAR